MSDETGRRGGAGRPAPPDSLSPGPGVIRGARWVAVLAGLVFLAGVIWKVAAWEQHVAALGAYGVLDFLPAGLLAAGSLVLEVGIAALLLMPKSWHRGLLAGAGFLLFTAVVLAWETLSGGGGDCGCLPFLTRSIGWAAVGQNLAGTLFMGSLGMLGTLGEEDQSG
ncbi:MAG: hypothetical protein R6W82_09030 [bacterium]